MRGLAHACLVAVLRVPSPGGGGYFGAGGGGGVHEHELCGYDRFSQGSS